MGWKDVIMLVWLVVMLIVLLLMGINAVRLIKDPLQHATLSVEMDVLMGWRLVIIWV